MQIGVTLSMDTADEQQHQIAQKAMYAERKPGTGNWFA
jgi:hypothetical protein